MRITAAAIKHGGKVYQGLRHCDIIKDIVKATGCKRVMRTSEQGFVTIEGDFVSREKARELVLASGQETKRPVGRILFSEDLW